MKKVLKGTSLFFVSLSALALVFFLIEPVGEPAAEELVVLVGKVYSSSSKGWDSYVMGRIYGNGDLAMNFYASDLERFFSAQEIQGIRDYLSQNKPNGVSNKDGMDHYEIYLDNSKQRHPSWISRILSYRQRNPPSGH